MPAANTGLRREVRRQVSNDGPSSGIGNETQIKYLCTYLFVVEQRKIMFIRRRIITNEYCSFFNI